MRSIVASLALIVTAAAANACSTVQGYRVPTNVELVEQADLVVLARVVSGPDSLEGQNGPDFFAPLVELEPVRVLKGVAAPGPLRVWGYFKWRSKEAFPLLPTPLDRPHPTALMGACIRQGYAKGALVVAMFSKTAEGYRQLSFPFARAVEDVADADALWVRAAEDYARIVAMQSGKKRHAAFVEERKRLLARADADSQAIARDIDAYLQATPG